MHELGLANSILDLVQQYVPEARAPQLSRVHVRIGEFAGVLPASLSFCFSAIVQGTPYHRATLDITRSQGREMVVSELELEDDPGGEKGTVPFSPAATPGGAEAPPLRVPGGAGTLVPAAHT